ncbi:hypothetical protein BKA82DRAFT_4016107 [Pisolithus tinctorius]|nr:hypothetical protein BKA82DRAFT_4016107 [Pisolithus tinctorius]
MFTHVESGRIVVPVPTFGRTQRLTGHQGASSPNEAASDGQSEVMSPWDSGHGEVLGSGRCSKVAVKAHVDMKVAYTGKLECLAEPARLADNLRRVGQEGGNRRARASGMGSRVMQKETWVTGRAMTNTILGRAREVVVMGAIDVHGGKWGVRGGAVIHQWKQEGEDP